MCSERILSPARLPVPPLRPAYTIEDFRVQIKFSDGEERLFWRVGQRHTADALRRRPMRAAAKDCGFRLARSPLIEAAGQGGDRPKRLAIA